MLAILTGLPHLAIVQQIKKLAYHIELPSSEIVAMKCAYVNDDDVPVVFYLSLIHISEPTRPY